MQRRLHTINIPKLFVRAVISIVSAKQMAFGWCSGRLIPWLRIFSKAPPIDYSDIPQEITRISCESVALQMVACRFEGSADLAG